MAIYDDKTPGTIKSSNNYLIINNIKSRTEAVFKASYLVASDVRIAGKITALFDLIVVGDVEAEDIDVKGKFICLGNCIANNTITVQDKFYSKSVKAKKVEVRDEITAGEIDVDVLKADGNIIVGQTLSIEELAYSEQRILCGETAFGAGKLSAYAIVTGEEIDLDDGNEAVVSPERIRFEGISTSSIIKNSKKYAKNNEYNTYLKELIETCNDNSLKDMFVRWLNALGQVEKIVAEGTFSCFDIGLLLTLTEISHSVYFECWETIIRWQELFLDMFNKMANGENIEDETFCLENLKKGQRLKHCSHGKGTITNLKKTDKTMADIIFDNGKEVSFQMDIALKFFVPLQEKTFDPQEVIDKMHVNIAGYGEWLAFLNIMRVYGNVFNDKLYEITMDLICTSMGIKPKFIFDRLKEKGWKSNG